MRLVHVCVMATGNFEGKFKKCKQRQIIDSAGFKSEIKIVQFVYIFSLVLFYFQLYILVIGAWMVAKAVKKMMN